MDLTDKEIGYWIKDVPYLLIKCDGVRYRYFILPKNSGICIFRNGAEVVNPEDVMSTDKPTKRSIFEEYYTIFPDVGSGDVLHFFRVWNYTRTKVSGLSPNDKVSYRRNGKSILKKEIKSELSNKIPQRKITKYNIPTIRLSFDNIKTTFFSKGLSSDYLGGVLNQKLCPLYNKKTNEYYYNIFRIQTEDYLKLHEECINNLGDYTYAKIHNSELCRSLASVAHLKILSMIEPHPVYVPEPRHDINPYHDNFLECSKKILFKTGQGDRNHMEDYYSCDRLSQDVVFLCVYDGHGGKKSASYFSKKIPKVLSKLNLESTTLTSDIQSELVKLDIDTYEKGKVNKEKKIVSSGSTVSGVLIFPDRYITINIGDSRTVILQDNKMISTVDHTPSLISEFVRVTETVRDFIVNGRVRGGLNLTRAMGDYDYKIENEKYKLEPSISAVPDVIEIPRKNQDQIFITSDGLLDVYDNCSLIHMIRTFGVEETCEYSLKIGAGVHDNYTILYVPNVDKLNF